MTTAELQSQEIGLKALIDAKLQEIGRDDAQAQADAQAILDLMGKLHGIQDQIINAKAYDTFLDLTKKQTDASMGTSAR